MVVAMAMLVACAGAQNGTSRSGAGVEQAKVVNSIGMSFARIEPGSFMMGSPDSEAGRAADETRHRVMLTKPFLMGTTHVTIGQWSAFVKDSGYKTEAEAQGWGFAWTGQKWERVAGASWHNPGFPQAEDHPVVDVSWNDAMAFCDWLSRKEGRHYRLPTEAEFEYCVRAGTQSVFPWGDSPDDGKGWANLADQTARQKYPNWAGFDWSDGYVFTGPAGHFRPNAWGVYDLTGNAWEWCSDWYGKYPDGDVTDPRGPSKESATQFDATAERPAGPQRVMRGGSWHSGPVHARSANRDHEPPDFRNCIKGFRAVMEVQ
jgi:formylglycine-generating enzyme required for sulfatase activity